MEFSIPFPLRKALTTGLSLRGRIYLAAATTLIAVAISLFSSLYAQQRLAAITQEILDARLPAILSANRVKQSLVSYDNALFHYLATKNSQRLRENQEMQRITRLEIKRLRALSSGRVTNLLLQNLHVESEGYFADAERLLKFSKRNNLPENAGFLRSLTWVRNQKTERKELSVLSAEGRERLLHVFRICDELVTLNQQQLEKAQIDMANALDGSRTITLISGIIAGGVVLLVSLGLAMSLIGSLNPLLEGVRRVEQGDLDSEIPVTTADEIGELTQAFNRMARNVREHSHQLFQETITDPLTGAYNQRHFRGVLKQELERARRMQQSLCLLMIDVDHFKVYNDTQGHESGNEVLKEITQTIRENLREIDILARYGGDELAIILPDTPPDKAHEAAQRIIEAVFHFHFPGQEALPNGRITLSIGGASFPKDALASTDLVIKADKALYAAKEAGRGCTRWFVHV